MRQIPVSLIVAITSEFGIGLNGKLPWSELGIRLSTDLKYFREVTTFPEGKQLVEAEENRLYNAVIMGRKTWESIPNQYQPLRDRLNIIISNTLPLTSLYEYKSSDEISAKPYISSSFSQSLEFLSMHPSLSKSIARVVVIGGSSLFEEALLHPWCDRIHLTVILSPSFQCDTFLTSKSIELLKEFPHTRRDLIHDNIVEGGVQYRILEYRK